MRPLKHTAMCSSTNGACIDVLVCKEKVLSNNTTIALSIMEDNFCLSVHFMQHFMLVHSDETL